jgi:hypothetical protein
MDIIAPVNEPSGVSIYLANRTGVNDDSLEAFCYDHVVVGESVKSLTYYPSPEILSIVNANL